MHEYSVPDGFMEISESLGNMMTSMANDPSVGLYYIQHHAQNTTPKLTSVEKTIKQRSQQVSLHTDDLNDSINTITSMKGYGLPITEQMIQDIEKSLALTSKRQPTSSSRKIPISWVPTSWTFSSSDAAGGGRSDPMNQYLSVTLKSARQKAWNLKWPQINSKDSKEDHSSCSDPWTLDLASAVSSSDPDVDTDELPLSSLARDDMEEDTRGGAKTVNDNEDLPHQGSFYEVRADREVRLEKWLKDSDHCDITRADTDTVR